MIQPKFSLGDRVYHVGATDPRYIIGVKMQICYDCVAFVYWTGRASYGDYPIEAFGNRCDVHTAGPLREEQIETEEDAINKIKARLDADIAATEKQLAEMKAEREEKTQAEKNSEKNL